MDWNFPFKAQKKVNGHLSQALLVTRGLQQGWPLSMILYITFAEIFLEVIRQNNGIKGTVYIGNNSSLAHLEMQLMYFEKATDIKYNKRKCMGIWLGSNKAAVC